MQTSKKQFQGREDIEVAITDCEEVIYKLRHELRWYTLGVRTFWIVLVTGITALIIGGALGISWLIFPGCLVLFVCFIVGVVTFASSASRPISDYREGLRLEKQQLAKLHRQLTAYDEHVIRQLSDPAQYKYHLPDLIASYRSRSDRDYRWFVTIQVIVIILSATVTSLAGGWLDRYVSVPWTVPVFSGLVSILTSFTLFFKFREKATNLRQTADAMDLEHMACSLGIGVYKGMKKEDALILLAERAEGLRKDQQQRQQQLEQSSQAEQKALQQEGQ